MCSKVHVCVPSVFTSGGQSEGRESRAVAVAAGVRVAELACGFFFLARASQSATEVQDRHLRDSVSRQTLYITSLVTHGLPSLPMTTPFGGFFGASSVTLSILPTLCVSSLRSALLTCSEDNLSMTPTLSRKILHLYMDMRFWKLD